MSGRDAEDRFEGLQTRLVDLWPTIRGWSDDDQTVVVVPSYSIDARILEHVGPMLAAYEERFLYMLFLLRQRRCRVVFVSSVPVDPVVLGSYLELVPGVEPSDARSRLELVCTEDPSPRPLARKLLERDDVLAAIASLVPAGSRAHLAMFNVTEAERDLALRLDLPIFGASPRHAALGTKEGCRRVFAEVDVPHPAGESVRGLDDVGAALARLRDAGASAAIVKLNEGVSGLGNATVALDGPLDEAVRGLPAGFDAQLQEQRGIVEELIRGDGLVSPSAQLRITPVGDVELLSTHDQLLGGPEGQTYVGCRFPADPAYARDIAEHAMNIGRHLAAQGVRGRFAVDFVVVPGDPCAVYAIEINLRKGGTTHPFLAMHFLADGSYDADAAVYRLPDGGARHYVAADSLGDERLRGIVPEDVLAGARRRGILYDAGRRRGVIFHMLSALPTDGKFGLTSIAPTAHEADDLWHRSVALVGEVPAGM